MVWAGKGHEPYSGVDAYFVDIRTHGIYTYDHVNVTWVDFKPGAWTFGFRVEDKDGHSIKEQAKNYGKEKKIWCIGSATRIYTTALYGYATEYSIDNVIPGAGLILSIGTIIAYGVVALLSTFGGDKGKVWAVLYRRYLFRQVNQ